MNRPHHPLSDLFAQLGLASDAHAMSQFISHHSPLDGHVRIHEASFWTAAQRSLLREAIEQDADWSAASDQLNAALRDGRARWPFAASM